MSYASNEKNKDYFKRENEFVWLHLLKWIFEDLIVG
jgi:hypothetical protein